MNLFNQHFSYNGIGPNGGAGEGKKRGENGTKWKCFTPKKVTSLGGIQQNVNIAKMTSMDFVLLVQRVFVTRATV